MIGRCEAFRRHAACITERKPTISPAAAPPPIPHPAPCRDAERSLEHAEATSFAKPAHEAHLLEERLMAEAAGGEICVAPSKETLIAVRNAAATDA
jgi:hypothetical protein